MRVLMPVQNQEVKARVLLSVLVLFVVCSALGVVYSKHQSRQLFVELTALQKQRDDMNVEWGQLQLEQSTWATHVRIENTASTRLQMKQLEYEKVVMVRP